MDNISTHQVLTIVTWFALTALLFLIALIARKYEKLSGARTYYQLFAVPVLLFAAGMIRAAQRDQITGNALGDLLMFAAGISLGVLCLHTYRLMTSN